MQYVKKFTNPEHEPGAPTPSGQMKAVVWHGHNSIKVDHVDRPKIQQGSDIIVKVTASSISPGFCKQVCAGDIPGMEKGQILGREAVGIVDDVGSEITKFNRGDRVVISFVIACGECSFCKRREFSACNRTNESKEFADTYGGWAPAAMFGGSRLYGNVPGTQAEYVRVPFGDANCYKVPNGVPDEKAVFVADTATTGLHATELGQVKQGDTVVIWGMGPVGLMAAKWAKMKGAARVIGVDSVNDRLRAAFNKFDLEVVDRTGLSSEELCQKLLKELHNTGADVTIDACGSCESAQGLKKKVEKAVGVAKSTSDVLKECLTVTRKFGNVAVVADYGGYVNHFPIGHVMMKHLTVRAGETPVQHYMKQVMDAIEAGELDPSELITHRYSLSDAAEAYGHAYKREEGYLKVLIRPDNQTSGGFQQHLGQQQPVHERERQYEQGYGDTRQHERGVGETIRQHVPGTREHEQSQGETRHHEQPQQSSYGTSRTQDQPQQGYGETRQHERGVGETIRQHVPGTREHEQSYGETRQHEQPQQSSYGTSRTQDQPQRGYGETRQDEQGYGETRQHERGIGETIRQHVPGTREHEQQQQPSSYGSRTPEHTSYSTSRTPEQATYGTSRQQEQQQPSQASERGYRGI